MASRRRHSIAVGFNTSSSSVVQGCVVCNYLMKIILSITLDVGGRRRSSIAESINNITKNFSSGNIIIFFILKSFFTSLQGWYCGEQA